MPRLIAELGRKLGRIFLGRIVVRGLGELRRQSPLCVATHFRAAEVRPLRTEPRVRAAMFAQWKKTRAQSAGTLLGGYAIERFRVKRVSLGKAKKCEVRQYKLNIKRRAAPKHSMARINRAPVVRHNRLNFLKKAPKFEHATLLAFYSPIFQEKVKKSALDKASGNLLFWYDNERVKIGEKYYLLLLRVFGGKEPLKWLWIQAGKKVG
ncbi:MAG: hypothetical protein LBQ36_08165 [Synergistaceae bacterium]|jgi:hypothetical protein|nr:hypothetical protein [Synergistaceae bacterium]